jgi:hypothetical protein
MALALLASSVGLVFVYVTDPYMVESTFYSLNDYHNDYLKVMEVSNQNNCTKTNTSFCMMISKSPNQYINCQKRQCGEKK